MINGTFGNSKPCRQCLKSIINQGIIEIMYTTGDINIPFRKIKTLDLLLEPEHICSSERHLLRI